MIFHAHPTESDYRHALAAHGVWAVAGQRKGGWRKKASVFLWAACFGAMGIAGAEPQLFSRQEWIVPAVPLIAVISFYPLVLLLLLVQRLLRSPSSLRPEPSGIVEQTITPKGAARGNKNRNIAFWIVFPAIGAVVAIIQMRRARLPSLAVSTNSGVVTTVMADNASIARVDGTTIFWGTLVASMLLGSLLVFFQKRYGAKDLVAATPTLLLPRTWECNEEWITERGELLQTTMKWEYLRKFLETPLVILLYPNEMTFYLIPKSAFATELELAKFMALLMEKVPNGMLQPRGGQGFMVQPLPAIPLQPTPENE